ncbi:MAG TPA: HAMP domain-containing sensor histidine kinase [Vampirovibrionales bacterium]
MQQPNKSQNINSKIPILTKVPFGANAFGEEITEVNGAWIANAVRKVKERGLVIDPTTGEQLQALDYIITELHKIISPALASILNEEYLSGSWNSYSAEFAFALASLCRRVDGADHTIETTESLHIDAPQEFLPIDMLDTLGNTVLRRGMFGARIVFKGISEKHADFDLIYPSYVKAIPEWKEIAYAQQEAYLKKAIPAFWGLKAFQLKALGRYEVQLSDEYGFEYRANWAGGELTPKNKGLLGGGNDASYEYLKKKFKSWCDFNESLRANERQNAEELMSQSLKLKTQSLEEYHSIKNIVEDQSRMIQALQIANKELEGVVHYMNEKKDELQHESSTWKASKVASDQLKKQAEEMAQIKSRLMSVVSHELRTPLSSLLGFTELLLGQDFDPEQIKEFLSTIYKESLRMKDLLDEFLDMQRLESGRIELNLEAVDFRDALKSVIESFRGYSAGVKIIPHLAANLPLIRADKNKLEQILKNFLSNAIKYSPEGGDVEVFTTCDYNNVTICVADKGLGIPEESIPKLFQEFYRVEKETHANIKGTGLGLSITKQLIEAHEGSVWVESTLGSGSKFYFKIPVYQG